MLRSELWSRRLAPQSLLEPLNKGGTGRLNDWRNFYYPTDPIGGSVAPDLHTGDDPVDTEFLDPAECYYVYGQAPPAPQKHSGYWADRRVWAEVNGVAAELPVALDAASDTGFRLRAPTGRRRSPWRRQRFFEARNGGGCGVCCGSRKRWRSGAGRCGAHADHYGVTGCTGGHHGGVRRPGDRQ